MTRSDIDNDLARLLGPDAIPDEERSSIMARLLADDEAMSLAADTAYVLRDLEAEDGIVVVDETADDEPPRVRDAEPAYDPKVVTLPPPSTRRTWRRPPARWLALAAVLAGVLLIPLALSRFGGRDSSGDFTALLAERQAGLPAGWEPAWGRTRGAGSDAADNARAARLGALHTQLEVAFAGRQTSKAREISGQIATALEYVTAGGTVSPIYRDTTGALAGQLAEAREGVAMLVGEDYFALGAWAEAARIAARQRDAEFFRARASRRMLDRAATVPSPEDATRAAVEKIRAALAPDQPDWAELETQTDHLLASLAR